jgi:hypothetical protein
MNGSEFNDDDGCLYQVARLDGSNVVATCFYPCHNDELLDCEKHFDMVHARELILRRLNG